MAQVSFILFGVGDKRREETRMKQITIELDDAHYKRSHYKRYYTEEEYAKQHKESESE